jgi:nucleoid DNA-binding protein
LTYTDLVKEIAQKLDLKPTEVSVLCQQTADIIAQELEQKQDVRIKNFGSFVTVKHKSRTVPDPREMTKRLVIFDQYLPKFRPSEALRAKLKDVMPADFEPDHEFVQPAKPTVQPTQPAPETVTVITPVAVPVIEQTPEPTYIEPMPEPVYMPAPEPIIEQPQQASISDIRIDSTADEIIVRIRVSEGEKPAISVSNRTGGAPASDITISIV